MVLNIDNIDYPIHMGQGKPPQADATHNAPPANDADGGKVDELRLEVEQARNHGSSWQAQEENLGRVSNEIHTGIGNARRMNAIGKFADADALDQHPDFFIDYRYLVSPRSAATGMMADTAVREQLFHLAATASEIISTLPAKPIEANIKQLGNALEMPVAKIKQKFGKEGTEKFVQTVGYLGRFLHHRFADYVCDTLNKHIVIAARTARASSHGQAAPDIITPADFQLGILRDLTQHSALSILGAARLPFGSEEVRTRKAARLLSALGHNGANEAHDSKLWTLLPKDKEHDGYYTRDNIAARLYAYTLNEINPYYDEIRQKHPEKAPGFDIAAAMQEFGITPDMVSSVLAQQMDKKFRTSLEAAAEFIHQQAMIALMVKTTHERYNEFGKPQSSYAINNSFSGRAVAAANAWGFTSLAYATKRVRNFTDRWNHNVLKNAETMHQSMMAGKHEGSLAQFVGAQLTDFVGGKVANYHSTTPKIPTRDWGGQDLEQIALDFGYFSVTTGVALTRNKQHDTPTLDKEQITHHIVNSATNMAAALGIPQENLGKLTVPSLGTPLAFAYARDSLQGKLGEYFQEANCISFPSEKLGGVGGTFSAVMDYSLLVSAKEQGVISESEYREADSYFKKHYTTNHENLRQPRFFAMAVYALDTSKPDLLERLRQFSPAAVNLSEHYREKLSVQTWEASKPVSEVVEHQAARAQALSELNAEKTWAKALKKMDGAVQDLQSVLGYWERNGELPVIAGISNGKQVSHDLNMVIREALLFSHEPVIQAWAQARELPLLDNAHTGKDVVLDNPLTALQQHLESCRADNPKWKLSTQEMVGLHLAAGIETLTQTLTDWRSKQEGQESGWKNVHDAFVQAATEHNTRLGEIQTQFLEHADATEQTVWREHLTQAYQDFARQYADKDNIDSVLVREHFLPEVARLAHGYGANNPHALAQQTQQVADSTAENRGKLAETLQHLTGLSEHSGLVSLMSHAAVQHHALDGNLTPTATPANDYMRDAAALTKLLPLIEQALPDIVLDSRQVKLMADFNANLAEMDSKLDLARVNKPYWQHPNNVFMR
ncbi:hypothetical protein, partial [Conchiformibius steedae]|uniref:hypothetical protein n=1 Tax=Conchiformibius steedae TaxID=153493 RepID=UPI0026EBAFC1